jgi:tRNA threonylcarbamoyladenosine biosynthesis protein TsaB
MTKCIAIDTSTNRFTLAAMNGRELYEFNQENCIDHAQDIYRNINNILTDSRLKLKDLDFVAFGSGPGRFTGLRIAASATQAITYTHQISVCSVSSLSTIAQLASENYSKDKIAVAMDAGRKQIYFGCYQTSKDGLVQPIFPDSLIDVDSFHFSEANFFGVGRGWKEYTNMKAQCSVKFIEDSEEILPDAKTMIKLAMRDFESGKVLEAFEALPNYLRDQIAD